MPYYGQIAGTDAAGAEERLRIDCASFLLRTDNLLNCSVKLRKVPKRR